MLNPDDIANIERGVDATINAIIEMAQVSIAHISTKESATVAGPLIGFVQACTEHRGALANKALQQALLAHPDLEEGEVATEGNEP
jgi:hypothetical protein